MEDVSELHLFYRYSGGSAGKSTEKSSGKEKSKALSPKLIYLEDDKSDDGLRLRGIFSFAIRFLLFFFLILFLAFF